MQIKELESDAEFAEAYPVIRELHSDLDERPYLELIPEMRAAGYRMFAVRKEAGIVAVAGVQRLTNLLLRPPLLRLRPLRNVRRPVAGARREAAAARRARGPRRGLQLRGPRLWQGTGRRAPLLRGPHGLREARLLHAQSVGAVMPGAVERVCPISARQEATWVRESGS